MTSGWEEIERLYWAASEQPYANRTAFLDRECPSEFRAEIDSLLAAGDSHGEFLDTPPVQLVADLLARGTGAIQPGQIISFYQVRSLLSMGGMGEVYLTWDTRSLEPAVLKVLPRHLIVDAPSLERFEREARSASALQHPNIVTIYEFGKSDRGMYIAMEWIDGETWRSLLNRGGIPLCTAARWGRQACGAVAAAHSAGIIHRDIKPENIMLRKDEVVKILDFGLARFVGVDLPDIEGSGGSGTISGTLSGTLSYMSPEVLRGETVSSASDVFSLGSVLYELFTGRHPFAGETPLDVFEAIECRTPVAPSSLRAGVPASLDAVLLQMLHREPEARLTAATIAAALDAVQFAE